MITENACFPPCVDPKIYQAHEHLIPLEKVDPHAVEVIQRLRQAGYKAYLVGGGVRDLLLNTTPKDFDISTSAKPEEIRRLFRNAILIGRRFRLAHIRFGKKILEVSTFRAGDTEAHELVTRDNEWGSEEQDVLRRDFTINGLFYDPEEQIVIDYVDGFADVKKKLLRTIGKPEARFTQDPVRMIRLLKFCARFGFEIEGPTLSALLECKKEIVKSSSARILEELFRMLESGAAKPFFHLLHEYGLLRPLLPELAHFFELHPNHMTFSLLHEFDAEKKKEPSLLPEERSLPLAALLWPLFDTYLKEVSKERERAPHLGEIQQIAHHVVRCVFSHFFKLPGRFHGIIAAILSSQYRFFSIDGKIPYRPRPSRDPFFPFALLLFQLRANQDSSLLPHYSLWKEACFGMAPPDGAIDLPPQRRRRRRRG